MNGYQVAPAELEGCLLDHPDVVESCVIGVPHDYCKSVFLYYMISEFTVLQLGKFPWPLLRCRRMRTSVFDRIRLLPELSNNLYYR